MRAVLACLMLAPVTTRAQEERSEPLPLPRAMQVVAQPLPGTAAERASQLPSTGTSARPLPTFPFRQVGATESAAAGAPAASPRKLAPRDAKASRPREGSKAPTPSAAVGTVVSSLAIVLGLFAGLVWFTKRFAPTGTGTLPKEAVELLGRAPLAGRQSMQLVRVGNRLLLVALSATGAQTLTEITDAVEVERLSALCQRRRPDSASASFSRVLGQLSSEPASESPRARVRGAA